MTHCPQYSCMTPYAAMAPMGTMHGGMAQEMRTLRVEGIGSITVQPDLAEVQLGVSTDNMSLTMAQAQNAAAITSVINAVTNLGIPSQDIATQSYTISPQYDYVDNQQVFRGYRVVHTLSITIRDLSRVGQIIDAAVAAGANFVNNISFTVANPAAYYQQALTLAIDDAIAKAMTIGRRFNLSISPVPVRIVETTFGGTPVEPVLFKAAAEAATPIQPGQQEIPARVEVTFTYS